MENLLSILIYLLMVALAGGLVYLIVAKIGVEKMRKITVELGANKELAGAAVRYAQQVYWNLDGKIRYEKAMEWMIAECKRYGIKFTVDQLDGLIHEALRTFKDEFGEEWGKAIAEPVGTE
jgi:hypothetical protein